MDYFQNLSQSLSTKVGELVPGVAGAIVVLIIGLLFAMFVKRLVLAMFKKTALDEKLGAKMGSTFRLDQFIAKLAYFLVLIYVLLMVLNMMGVGGVLEPLSNMLNEFFQFLPNIVAAVIIGYVGYFIATLVSEATGFLALSLQNVSAKAGLTGSLSLQNIVKQIVFILVFIPILIAALDALKMESISGPATEMFSNFLEAIPQIIAAVAILAVFYIAGKYITAMLSDLLANLGIDEYSSSLGLSGLVGNASLSHLIGNIIFFFLMFGGVIAAMDKLNMPQITGLLHDVFDIGGRVFFGLVILMLGNFIANIAYKTMNTSEENAWMAMLAKYAIIFIFLALGLHTMGIGQDIVNLAFGLTMGALAVAFALSFGLGGREAAGKAMGRFLDRFEK